MELSLPNIDVNGASGRDLRVNNRFRIESGEEFIFRVTNVQNPPSFEPSHDSIVYEVVTKEGQLIEEML